MLEVVIASLFVGFAFGALFACVVGEYFRFRK